MCNEPEMIPLVEALRQIAEAEGMDNPELVIEPAEDEPDGWIMISDNLPRPGQRVMLYTSQFQIVTGYLDWVDKCSIPHFVIWELPGKIIYCNNATHWRLLPQPPIS